MYQSAALVNQAQRRFDRQFYLGASLVFLALVFWTFARSYYLRALFDSRPLTPLLHVHAAVMTGWVVLLAVQSGLIAARRVQWHRWVGTFGAVWAVFVVAMGSTMTVLAAAREVHRHSAQAPVQVMIMGLELVQMLLFAGLVVAAIWLRSRTDWHKRLMLLTIACMLPSALARLPVAFMSNAVILAGCDLFILASVGIDSLRNRRLHPAFGRGGSAVFVAINLMFFAVQTPAWVEFATRLVS